MVLPYASVAMKEELTVTGLESAVAETTLPARSQVTAAEAAWVVEWPPRPLHAVDSDTPPVGSPVAGQSR